MSITHKPLDTASASRPRLLRLDMARAIALIAMAIYHFGWDLEFFGYMTAGTTGQGGWRLFARCIASSFLFLVGFSLVLAHGRGIRWRPMLKRLSQIILAAAAISAVTYYLSPESYIFFGILHEIAFASLVGLLFLRLPPLLTVLVASLVLAAPHFARSDIFNQPWLAWVGLSTQLWRSNDYVPVFPWFGAVLLGIAAARFSQQFNLLRYLAGGIKPRFLQKPLCFMGQHSLAFYLIHQPVLIALVFLYAQIAPPARPEPHQLFTQSCIAGCSQTAGTALCQQFCSCVVTELDKAKLFEDVFIGKLNQQNSPAVQGIVTLCSPEESAGQ
ncbi:heparan-alpha-glucosaminide N-acetyltransferase [Daeguia caeni]|uniref:Heparan-alpha-glucosaminide N-acetyltransferase n=1 Tax=Daeguia caeni TaxID=439612 RepID=A0ABV9H6G5_9HYPH